MGQREIPEICVVAGARPNFMKIAPILAKLVRSHKVNGRLVHTGQHYDKVMSGNFFEELRIKEPDANLGCGGGTQAEQCAAIMVAFEKELTDNPTDLVVVVGDVTSTMACSIVAKKLGVKVAHVEAGIRSGDMSMPEEINRIVTDSITDIFFTTTKLAGENLLKLGVPRSSIHFVGNVMIDTLRANEHRFRPPAIWGERKLKEKGYIVMTMHRPGNVDEIKNLEVFLETIDKSANGFPVIFPAHPRTRKMLSQLKCNFENIVVIDPLGYLEFNYLVKNALCVITDSGGITEEATVMNVPCLTLRDNTERPETVEMGTNELVGTDPSKIPGALEKVFSGQWKQGSIPELWDGKAAERIVDVLVNLYG